MHEQGQLQIDVDDRQELLRLCEQMAQLLRGDEPAADPSGSSTPDDFGATQSPPELSVVLPVCDELDNLNPLYDRLTAVLASEGASYEILFVDDGCTDGSSACMTQLALDDPHVRLVELARNFGHQVAISAGLDFARGDAVIVMDADLQDPPEMLPAFISKWREGYDVVYAVRQQRRETWAKHATYALFYRILKQLSSVDMPLDAGDFSIMDRRVVDLLTSMPERNRFVRGLRSYVGLRQIGVPYERPARQRGRTKYTFGRLVRLALDGLFSFSRTPLRVASLLGLAISVASFLMAGFYFVKRLTSGLSPPGFATLVVAIFFLAGVQLTTIGVLGEYVGRVFEEVKRRPLYVVRRVIGD